MLYSYPACACASIFCVGAYMWFLFFLEDFGLSVDPHPCGSRTAGPPNIRERERAPSDRRKKGGMELDSVLLNRWLSDGKCS